MFRYSHRKIDSYKGEFSTPQEALQAGRQEFGADVTTYISNARSVKYSDLTRDVLKLFFTDMNESAVRAGCSDADVAIGELPDPAKADLLRRLVDTVEEWETELPNTSALGGWVNTRLFEYTEGQIVGEEWLREPAA